MPIETVANTLDDATHTRLDQAILVNIPGGALPLGMRGATLLLSSIASNSDGFIDPKYKDVGVAASLLIDHPDLETKLWEAWETKSFKNIRKLSMYTTSINDIYINPNSRNSSTTTTDDDSHGRGCNYSCTGAGYSHSKNSS
jgi:hypothetical protein